MRFVGCAKRNRRGRLSGRFNGGTRRFDGFYGSRTDNNFLLLKWLVERVMRPVEHQLDFRRFARQRHEVGRTV
jgi:hypothetical protein